MDSIAAPGEDRPVLLCMNSIVTCLNIKTLARTGGALRWGHLEMAEQLPVIPIIFSLATGRFPFRDSSAATCVIQQRSYLGVVAFGDFLDVKAYGSGTW